MIEPVKSQEEAVLKPAIEMVENWYEGLRDCTPADDRQINRIAPKTRKPSVNLSPCLQKSHGPEAPGESFNRPDLDPRHDAG